MCLEIHRFYNVVYNETYALKYNVLLRRDMANFEPMLATLDNNKERLRIKSYGISDTSLEEVCSERIYSIYNNCTTFFYIYIYIYIY